MSKNMQDIEDKYAGEIVKMGSNSASDFSEIEDDLEADYEEKSDEESVENSEDLSEEENLKMFADSKDTNEKVEAVRLQLSLVDALLTCRIKLQKFLQCDALLIDQEALRNFTEKFARILEYFEGLNLDLNEELTESFQRTSLMSKFSKFEQNPVEQIENILFDRERLIKRTQKDRTEEDDSTEITRRWLKVQERRARKRSRPVTTYHTRKAKKLSYEVHKKMVNFMAPDEKFSYAYTHE